MFLRMTSDITFKVFYNVVDDEWMVHISYIFPFKFADFDERILKQQQEEEERKRQRREKKKEKKVSNHTKLQNLVISFLIHNI